MKELTHNAKIAVLKILNDIVNADNIVKDVEVDCMNEDVEVDCMNEDVEVDCMNEIARSFELADNYMVEVNNLVTLQALAIVRTLSTDLKEEIAQMMGKMIIINKDINYNEVKLYNAVCESCNIERNFNIEDYPPEITISGAYVNLK